MNKINIIILIFASFIFCIIGSFWGFKIAKVNISKDLFDLTSKIDQLFQNKDVIQDGHAELLSGIKTNNGYSLLSGGFTIYRLSKESGGYVKSMLNAGDITWLKPEYDVHPVYGFRTPNYRPEPQNAYSDALRYLLYGTDKEPNNSYTTETFTEIKDFPEGFNSQYYSITQKVHPTESYFKKNNSWTFPYVTYKLEYSENKEFFGITINVEKANSVKYKFSLLGFGIGLIFTFVLYFTISLVSSNSGESKNLLNKKWKNIASNSIMIIEPKIFGKYYVTLVENDKISRGSAKISEKGKSIQLSFIDSEIFYRLKSVNNQKLEMINLANNLVVQFVILGSEALGKSGSSDNEENVP
jgi:hypothetical protein